MDLTTASIAHWEALADRELRLEEIDTAAGVWAGGSSNPYRNKAKTYRDAAEALRIGQRTGIAHCSCHLIPLTDCAKRAATKGR